MEELREQEREQSLVFMWLPFILIGFVFVLLAIAVSVFGVMLSSLNIQSERRTQEFVTDAGFIIEYVKGMSNQTSAGECGSLTLSCPHSVSVNAQFLAISGHYDLKSCSSTSRVTSTQLLRSPGATPGACSFTFSASEAFPIEFTCVCLIQSQTRDEESFLSSVALSFS